MSDTRISDDPLFRPIAPLPSAPLIESPAEIDETERVESAVDRSKPAETPLRRELTRPSPALEAARARPSLAERMGAIRSADAAPNLDILFIGLNREAPVEAEGLAKTQGGSFSVELVAGSPNGKNMVRVEGGHGEVMLYDVTKAADLEAFVASLGLPAERSADVKGVIDRTPLGGKDEIAELARIWSRAEHGEAVPTRLVLSAHSTGEQFWGDHGKFDADHLSDLAAAMPRAAALIQHVDVAACYVGNRAMAERFHDMFPNLKTYLSYAETSPKALKGSIGHLKAWERATREGRFDRRTWGHDAATWTRESGFDDGRPPESVEEAMRKMGSYEGIYKAYFSGRSVVTATSAGPLRDYYNLVQRVLHHPDLRKSGKQPRLFTPGEVLARRDQAIRLNYYRERIAPRFALEHAGAIADGYRALGLEPPAFAAMPRKAAVAEIQRFDAAYDASEQPAAARDLHRLLNGGLLNLDPRLIPEDWI
jgi:hypothetical protein